VSFPVGAKKPKTRQLHNLAGAGAMGGSFCLLFGLIFFVPMLGLAVGAGLGGCLRGAVDGAGPDEPQR
jgi:uncharacterized membrane protein